MRAFEREKGRQNVRTIIDKHLTSNSASAAHLNANRGFTLALRNPDFDAIFLDIVHITATRAEKHCGLYCMKPRTRNCQYPTSYTTKTISLTFLDCFFSETRN